MDELTKSIIAHYHAINIDRLLSVLPRLMRGHEVSKPYSCFYRNRSVSYVHAAKSAPITFIKEFCDLHQNKLTQRFVLIPKFQDEN